MGSTSNLSLALTLSNLMLPGVSVINSGEEYGEVANTKFIWDEASNKPDLAATHEGKLSLSMVQVPSKRRPPTPCQSRRYVTTPETKILFSNSLIKETKTSSDFGESTIRRVACMWLLTFPTK